MSTGAATVVGATGATSGACAESELEVSAEAGRGGGDGRRTTAGGGTPAVEERGWLRFVEDGRYNRD